jgi:SPASM domain peptide maturase of grasp-with-spasm system
MSNKPYFCLYAHNIPVRGATRSAIYDLQRQNVVPVPNVLYDILLDFKQHPWTETQERYAPNNPQLFAQYLSFLQKKDLGFFAETPNGFPELKLHWYSPHRVQNAVLSYAFAHYSLRDVLTQLDALQCRHVELRLSLQGHCWAEIVDLFRQMEAKSFLSVTLLLAYSSALVNEQQLGALYEEFPKIQCIIVHAAPMNFQSATHPGKIAYVTQDLQQEKPRNRNVVNLDYFTEALQFNPYFNRKVCVTDQGSIKNCLLLSPSFGNVNTTRLEAVLANPDFQELWHAAPDQTLGLRDSELRYAHFSADYLVRNPATGLFDLEHRGLQLTNPLVAEAA